MSVVFDRGNAYLNGFVNELMLVLPNDHLLEIGFGTGELIHEMAKQIDGGHVEGVDFSSAMVSHRVFFTLTQRVSRKPDRVRSSVGGDTHRKPPSLDRYC